MPGIIRNLLDNLWGLATSDSVSVTVTEPPPLVEVLTISADKISIETDEKVTFTGQLTVDGVGKASVDIELYVNGVAEKYGMTDSGGYYSIYYRPPTAGTYTFYTKSWEP